jgi:hypothetical protein
MGVYPGPDTDVGVPLAMRFDRCHMSAEGSQRHAELWLEAIRNLPPGAVELPQGTQN